MSVKKRGFGSMSMEDKKRIASMGGKAAHQKGNAHEWTSAEAKAAGQKGGAVRGKQRGVKRGAA